MTTQELRAEARFPVTRRGSLSAGGDWFACMVLDISNSGLLILSNKQLEVGQILDLRCELYPGEGFACMVEVMHSSNDSAGTMITEIDEKSKRLLQRYVEEQLAIGRDKH